MLTITPPCSFIHALHARWHSNSGPTRLTSSTLATARGSVSIIGPKAGFVPALLTRMSRRPRRSTQWPMDASIASGSPAEPAYTVASAPIVRSAASVSSSSCCLRASTQTDAPAAAYASAIARPIPRVPPVTSATFPSRRKVLAGSITVTPRGKGLASEVQAGLALGALGRDRVHVALTEDQVVLALDLRLEAAVGREQHLVTVLDVAHGRPDLHDLGPDESPADVGGGRDQDARARLAVPCFLGGLHEQTVGGDPDRLLGVAPRVIAAGGHGAVG